MQKSNADPDLASDNLLVRVGFCSQPTTCARCIALTASRASALVPAPRVRGW